MEERLMAAIIIFWRLTAKVLSEVLGYIPTSHFDPALKDRNILWLALWKVIDESHYTGLGLRMLATLGRMEPHVAIAVSGINKETPRHL